MISRRQIIARHKISWQPVGAECSTPGQDVVADSPIINAAHIVAGHALVTFIHRESFRAICFIEFLFEHYFRHGSSSSYFRI